MAAFEDFKLWYAKDLTNNEFADADTNVKIQNSAIPAGEELSLIYCLAGPFAKRHTDVSNAIATDPTSPDTGTGMSNVTLRISQSREVTPTVSVLDRLIDMFYNKSTDTVFKKGRFGLETSDHPKLDCLPIATAGYKLLDFQQEPNQDTPGITIFVITLKFLGDHTKLGTRTTPP